MPNLPLSLLGFLEMVMYLQLFVEYVPHNGHTAKHKYGRQAEVRNNDLLISMYAHFRNHGTKDALKIGVRAPGTDRRKLCFKNKETRLCYSNDTKHQQKNRLLPKFVQSFPCTYTLVLLSDGPQRC